jgi:hypothetical protein
MICSTGGVQLAANRSNVRTMGIHLFGIVMGISLMAGCLSAESTERFRLVGPSPEAELSRYGSLMPAFK